MNCWIFLSPHQVSRRPAAPGFAALAIAASVRVQASLPQQAMWQCRLWVAELQRLGNDVRVCDGFPVARWRAAEPDRV
jgi:hypothetical protein